MVTRAILEKSRIFGMELPQLRASKKVGSRPSSRRYLAGVAHSVEIVAEEKSKRAAFRDLAICDCVALLRSAGF